MKKSIIGLIVAVGFSMPAFAQDSNADKTTIQTLANKSGNGFSNGGSTLFGGGGVKDTTPYPSDNKTEKVGLMDLSEISLNWIDNKQNFLIRHQIPVMVINATQSDIDKLATTYPGISFGPSPKDMATVKSIFTYYGVNSYPATLHKGWVFPQ